MQIAILTLDGFNELDSFIAAGILNRMKAKGWAAHITCPTPEVTSMAGVTIQRQKPLEFLTEADAVLIGSGIKTRDYAAEPAFLSQLRLSFFLRSDLPNFSFSFSLLTMDVGDLAA